MKKIILMLISICLFSLPLTSQNKTLNDILEKYKGINCLLNLSLMAQNKILDDILEEHKGKEAISEIKELLLKDINSKNKEGRTALMLASRDGYTEVVEVLIESGVDINIKDNNGYTALDWASQEGHTEIAELLKAALATE